MNLEYSQICDIEIWRRNAAALSLDEPEMVVVFKKYEIYFCFLVMLKKYVLNLDLQDDLHI